MGIDLKTRRLIDLFFCYDRKRTALLNANEKQLAHYTTADAAMKIIKGKSLWLRNAGVMNDYSEIAFGKSVLEPILESSLGNRLFSFLDTFKDGAGEEVKRRHGEHIQHARETVFMASLSEHVTGNRLGLLSMWRAYGGPVAGVALIFDRDVTKIEPEAQLNISASPVFYGDPNDFVLEFLELINTLEQDAIFLKECDPDVIINFATYFLQVSMYTIKHPGFKEENEWRVIYRPYEASSPHILPLTVTISGIPQAIYQLPFHKPDADPSFNIPELDLNHILKGVIIGPCLYPETVFRAFVDEMDAAGIINPKDRITFSEIPLRQQG